MKQFFCLVFLFCTYSQCLAEEEPSSIEHFNAQRSSYKEELRKLYSKAGNLKCDTEFLDLKKKIEEIKNNLNELDRKWKQKLTQKATTEEDIWDLGETSIANLLMEFGSSEYVYVIPKDIGLMKIYLYSAVSIPRESWDELIDFMLAENGIGIKKINPFAKQLYLLKQDKTQVDSVVAERRLLHLCPENSRVAYILTCLPEDGKSIQSFFEKFSNPKISTIHLIGNQVIIVSQKESIEKLLNLYDVAWNSGVCRNVKIIPTQKISPEEAQKIIENFFEPKNVRIRPSLYPQHQDQVHTMILSQGLALIGTESSIERAEGLIKNLEEQIIDPSELITYWYTCRHSDPEELAKVLEKVYATLVQLPKKKPEEKKDNSPLDRISYNSNLPIHPKKVEAGSLPEKKEIHYGSFIVDPKTTSILMVARKEELPKIKKIIRKLDVPKKMVQIEVLLVEKRLDDRSETGINLLKIGTASGKKETAIKYDTKVNAIGKGVLDFIISRPKGDLPAYDFTYSLLMAQDDIRINANPSIVTVNQTPATISIVEELSINNGAVQMSGNNGVSVEKSFSRAQYGITIVMTPTIHFPDLEEKEDKTYITMQTNINFDTAQTSQNDRPPVTRRHIENEVRVADGETVIIGGLKRLSAEEKREKIPFLGDLPGIGKLFGTTKKTDSNTEMFIFITPKILSDSSDELRQFRKKELEKRPGDLPEFLRGLRESRENQKKKIFEDSLKLLFESNI